MEKILIFGGAFDPPHVGHIMTARYIIEKIRPDIFMVFPTGIPPHKKINSDSKNSDRFEMARLAFEPLENETGVKVVVSDSELIKKEVSYTVNTVKDVKRKYPESDIYLYIGSDMVESFEKWYKYEEILKLVKIVTVKRYDPLDEKNSLEDKLFSEKCQMIREKGKGIYVIDKDVIIASSTEVREELVKLYGISEDKKDKMCPSLLTKSVFRYIISNGIYNG